jgi:GMP synthase (glutamine-hydrolysing)
MKTGTTLEPIREVRGDFEDWIREGTGYASDELSVRSVYRGEAPLDPSEVSGVIVTGSSALVSEREPWSEQSSRWLSRAVAEEVPVLGICYGHQLLAHGCGGRVERNPLGREIGTVTVELEGPAADDPLFEGLPRELGVQVSHVESVLELPPGARRLGSSAGDPNQVFALGEVAWGVQFHPEFDADIVRGYIAGRRASIVEEGFDADALTRDACDTNHGTRVLRRFGEIVRERAG